MLTCIYIYPQKTAYMYIHLECLSLPQHLACQTPKPPKHQGKKYQGKTETSRKQQQNTKEKKHTQKTKEKKHQGKEGQGRNVQCTMLKFFLVLPLMLTRVLRE